MKRLIKIFWKKEIHYWKRTFRIIKEANFIIFLLVSLAMILPHYASAFMHFLFEIFLLIFYKKGFEINMIKLEESLIAKI